MQVVSKTQELMRLSNIAAKRYKKEIDAAYVESEAAEAGGKTKIVL